MLIYTKKQANAIIIIFLLEEQKKNGMNTNRILFVCTICLIESRDSQHVLTCIH